MKKRRIGYGVLVMLLMVAFTFAGCEGPQGPQGKPGPDWVDPNEPVMVPQTLTVMSDSFLGPQFPVHVTVSARSITGIEHDATTAHHTAPVGPDAIAVLTQRILNHQTIEVDLVAGATATSMGFLNAVWDALELAKAPPRMFEPTPRSQTTVNADVLVIGSGVSGFSAAYTAASLRPNARVILIEQMETPGGTTRFALDAVTMPADDAGDINLWRDYLMMRSRNQAELAMVQRWAETARDAVRFINGSIPGTSTGTGTMAEVNRQFSVPVAGGFGGGGITRNMNRLRENGVIVWTSVQGTELLQTAGVVTGARARHADSVDITFALNPGGSVILATGGFDNNFALMQQFNRDSAFDNGHGIRGCGSGIEMAMAIGADTVFKGGKISMGARDSRRAFPGGIVGFGNQEWGGPVTISRSGAVYTGLGENGTFPLADGNRTDTALIAYPAEAAAGIANNTGFVSTTPRTAVWFDRTTGSAGYPIQHRWMIDQRWAHAENARQTNPGAFTIGGAPSYDQTYSFWIPSRPAGGAPTAEQIANEWMFQADHADVDTSDPAHPLRVLAPLVGMDPAVLIAAWTESGIAMDDANAWRLTRVAPSSMGSMGGLRLNTNAQVLRNGQPIVGLYAAGDVANGQFYYLEYPGSGHGLSLGLTFGFIAGTHAADRLPAP